MSIPNTYLELLQTKIMPNTQTGVKIRFNDRQQINDSNSVENIEKLIEEELVVTIGNGDASTFTIDENSEKEFSKAASKLDKLTINKYSDMQDMLLLDPIHDVDDKGWPEPKKDD